jgi:hypothetical protein
MEAGDEEEAAVAEALPHLYSPQRRGIGSSLCFSKSHLRSDRPLASSFSLRL